MRTVWGEAGGQSAVRRRELVEPGTTGSALTFFSPIPQGSQGDRKWSEKRHRRRVGIDATNASRVDDAYPLSGTVLSIRR